MSPFYLVLVNSGREGNQFRPQEPIPVWARSEGKTYRAVLGSDSRSFRRDCQVSICGRKDLYSRSLYDVKVKKRKDSLKTKKATKKFHYAHAL